MRRNSEGQMLSRTSLLSRLLRYSRSIMGCYYTIQFLFSNLSYVHIFSLSLSLSLSIFFPRSSRRVIISNNSRNYFIRRLKSSQHLRRFLFRFISVLVSRAVLSDALFRVLRVLTPSFFLFSFLLLRFGVRNADEVAFEILRVVSGRTV